MVKKSSEIRSLFLGFFKARGHEIVPSAPIVVKNDPTLMFTNAGMNQFKDLFLGNQAIKYNRVADTQKCLRVSGKHNDLEEVGVDTYHHTMFEMLGNWSFGDPANPAAGYFKTEAIQWSYELLVDVLGIDKRDVYATVFEGDPDQGLELDKESLELWKKYLPEDHILLGSKKDNFWEMGDTGPCGPCTEIHVDCRSETEKKQISGATLVNQDHPQVIEIWNNVFIQFNRLKDGSLKPLAAKHVDTGMGFERLVRVLQGKDSNYDTDIFTPTIDKIASITKITYQGTSEKKDIAFRVIADHIRAICFTIADGQLPSNTGAGYVIRRILRRAVRYYYSYLNYQSSLLSQLVPLLADQYKEIFPELYKQRDFVAKVIQEEENSFLRTLESGIKRFNQIVSESNAVIAGDRIFELMDTYGFPVDLSRLMAGENGLSIDETGFEKALEEQKHRSRVSAQVDHDDWVEIASSNKTVFQGYEKLSLDTQVVKYRKFSKKDSSGYQIVLAETPFYANSGGQVGDTGWLYFGEEKIAVTDTRKENELIVHFCDQLPDDLAKVVRAEVDSNRRRTIAYHHTATHLMHAALRKILGTHVAQKGSLVAPDYLRFDFSHFSKLSDSELASIEAMVNAKIRENIPVVIQSMPKDEALKTGAMALFGEKYGDIVRVVIIDPEYSIELCGGTHVMRTGDLGVFKIMSETAIAAGVRRVEALCGGFALEWINKKISQQHQLLELLGNPKDPNAKLEQLILQNKSQEKEIESLKTQAAQQLQQELISKVENFSGISFLSAVVTIDDPRIFKTLGHNLSVQLGRGVVALGNNSDGKAQIQINISTDLADKEKFNAGLIIKEIAPIIQGGGGGQLTQASAGGTKPDALLEALQQIKCRIQ